MAGAAAGAAVVAGGAAGGAGVDEDAAGAGVAGAADEEEPAALGSALGYAFVSREASRGPDLVAGSSYLVHDADDEALLLNLVGLDGVLVLQDLTCCLRQQSSCACPRP